MGPKDEKLKEINKQKKALEKISALERSKIRCLQKEKEIESQNEFLIHVIESLPHPFYVLDAKDYTIKIANSAARLGELSPNTTCYNLTHRRAHPCDGLEGACPLQVVKSTKKPFSVEHVHYDHDGNVRHVEVHAYPIFDEKDEVVQMIEYSLDITERKKLEEELRNYAEKIKLFAYSISHDLKNPLIAINGLIKLLNKKYYERLDQKGNEYCDMIINASEQVLKLIKDINNYINAKESNLIFEKIRPDEILESIRFDFGVSLNKSGVDLTIPEKIPEIRADKLSFFRVFRNLIDNALKYGGDQLTRINIEYNNYKDLHVFSVIDNGMGIEEEDINKIFNPFQRGQSCKGKEGTGLGLSIVNQIAKKHKGKAWVESKIGQGTTIHIAFSK